MRVTVCELSAGDLDAQWESLVRHSRDARSDLVVLPEFGFGSWLPASREPDADAWRRSVEQHDTWLGRLPELGARVVVGTRPVIDGGKRFNEAYVWESGSGCRPAHRKVYLPDEPGFWEASWYDPGPKEFRPVATEAGTVGFLICTELWFLEHARAYGAAGVDLLICPRATPEGSREKWTAGGRVAAVCSGAFCLSSNHAGGSGDATFAGTGWIIEPEEGDVRGLTSGDAPALTLDIDLDEAKAAKRTYPRYVG
jgi:N-carbamoylputrescine amidase